MSRTRCRPTRRVPSTPSAPSCRPSGSSCSSSGILAADDNLGLMLGLLVAGGLFLVWFFLSVRAKERAGEGAAAVDQPVPQPDLEPRPDHPEHPVADAHGDLVRGRRLPAGRARLRRDRDRRDLHRGHGGSAPDVTRLPSGSRSGGPSGRLIMAGFVLTIVGIGILLAMVSRLPECLGLRARVVPDRPGSRADADPVGQRRAVVLRRGAARRDLGPVPERVQPRLVPRHRDRRHDPRRRHRRHTGALVRPRPGRPGASASSDWSPRPSSLANPPRRPRCRHRGPAEGGRQRRESVPSHVPSPGA